MITSKQRQCIGIKFLSPFLKEPLEVKYPVRGSILKPSDKVVAVSKEDQAFTVSCSHVLRRKN
jgi:hypothetical protein